MMPIGCTTAASVNPRARRLQMGEQSDPPNRPSSRRRRFTEGMDDTASRLRGELPNVPVLVDRESAESVDDELRRRCETILEQVAEINGILSRNDVLPADYAEECRDRLVGVTRSTEEILESVEGPRPPGSMSAWLLRRKREGRVIVAPGREAH